MKRQIVSILALAPALAFADGFVGGTSGAATTLGGLPASGYVTATNGTLTEVTIVSGSGAGLTNLPTDPMITSNLNQFGCSNLLYSVQQAASPVILLIGNSYMGGWASYVSDYFQFGHFGAYGGGMLGINRSYASAGSGTGIDNPALWPCGLTSYSAASGQSNTFTLNNGGLMGGTLFDTVGWLFLKTNGGGTFNITMNGTNWATGISTDNGGALDFGYFVVTNDSGYPGTNYNISTYGIVPTSGTVLSLGPVLTCRSARSPIIVNWYRSSGDLIYYATNPIATKALKWFNPSLIIGCHLQSGDAYRADVGPLSSWITGTVPGVDLLWVGQHMFDPGNTSTFYCNSNMLTGNYYAREMCHSNHWSYFDGFNCFGDWYSLTNNGYFNPGVDAVHLTGQGFSVMANKVFNWYGLDNRTGSQCLNSGYVPYYLGPNGGAAVLRNTTYGAMMTLVTPSSWNYWNVSNQFVAQTVNGDLSLIGGGSGGVYLFANGYKGGNGSFAAHFWPSGGLTLGTYGSYYRGDPGDGGLNLEGNITNQGVLTTLGTGQSTVRGSLNVGNTLVVTNSVNVLSGAFTNNGLVWLAAYTNNVPNHLVGRDGSMCSVTNGTLYLRSNAAWLRVLTGP
jgi:hypothetical protein